MEKMVDRMLLGNTWYDVPVKFDAEACAGQGPKHAYRPIIYYPGGKYVLEPTQLGLETALKMARGYWESARYGLMRGAHQQLTESAT